MGIGQTKQTKIAIDLTERRTPNFFQTIELGHTGHPCPQPKSVWPTRWVADFILCPTIFQNYNFTSREFVVVVFVVVDSQVSWWDLSHHFQLRSVYAEEFQVICKHQAVRAFEDAREVICFWIYRKTEAQEWNTILDVQCRRFCIAYSDKAFSFFEVNCQYLKKASTYVPSLKFDNLSRVVHFIKRFRNICVEGTYFVGAVSSSAEKHFVQVV